MISTGTRSALTTKRATILLAREPQGEVDLTGAGETGIDPGDSGDCSLRTTVRVRARRSLRMLTRRAVELEIVSSIVHRTIRTTLNKNDLSLTATRRFLIPAHSNASFVAALEIILDTYAVRIIVALDNLNTHRLSSLYLTFPPAEADRIARKIELRFTPKPAS